MLPMLKSGQAENSLVFDRGYVSRVSTVHDKHKADLFAFITDTRMFHCNLKFNTLAALEAEFAEVPPIQLGLLQPFLRDAIGLRVITLVNDLQFVAVLKPSIG